MRIAVGCIGHETNTFSPVATTIDNFKKGSYHRDGRNYHHIPRYPNDYRRFP